MGLEITWCLIFPQIYLVLAKPIPDEPNGQDGGASLFSDSKLLGLRLPSFLGNHALLSGSVTDKIDGDDPQESLVALLAARANTPPPPIDEEKEIREDPLPGNLTHRFHGTCRSHYPPTVPNVLMRQIWKSPKMRRFTDVSLVTHLSLDMLPKLEYQCERWSGRVAAAVYVKLPYDSEPIGNPYTEKVNETLSNAENTVDAFFRQIHDGEFACTLDVLLAYEDFNPGDIYLGLYPINSLRNRALQLADTENVLVVDVDVVPNIDLSHDLHIMSLYETLNRVTGNRQAIVLPAITVTEIDEDPIAMSRWVNRSLEGVDRVQLMYEKGKIKAFETIRNPLGQVDTNLPMWINSTKPYRLNEIHEGYEPFYLAKKASLPWYDERFRGLKLNKVLHTWHMHKIGFMFVVTPRAYVVHVPHVKGLTWLETRRRGHYKKMVRMSNQSMIDMEEDAYDPITLFQCATRRSPKWTWY